MDAAEQFSALKKLYPDAVLLSEGGKPCVYLPSATFRAAGATATMSLLLFPSEHTSYTTRLFFERAIHERVQNWTQHTVVARNWWTPSFQGVTADQPWASILFAHLRSVA